MRPRLIRNGMVVLIAAVALFTAACNKSQPRTDAQVASDIQAKLNADQAVQNKQIAVLAANGVITLSGSVSSEAERSAVASDAANVSGVRTVVNNLVVNNLSAQPADAANFRNSAEAAMRHAKARSENGFKIELAKRCLTHALNMAMAI